MVTIHWTLDDENRLSVAWAEEQMAGMMPCPISETVMAPVMPMAQSAPAKPRSAPASFFTSVYAFLNKSLTPIWKS